MDIGYLDILFTAVILSIISQVLAFNLLYVVIHNSNLIQPCPTSNPGIEAGGEIE